MASMAASVLALSSLLILLHLSSASTTRHYKFNVQFFFFIIFSIVSICSCIWGSLYADFVTNLCQQIRMKNVTRLCHTRSLVTVNGKFPGPKIMAREGDRVIVKVVNHVEHNITLHWYVFELILLCLLAWTPDDDGYKMTRQAWS